MTCKDTDGNYYFQSEVTNTQFEKSIATLGKMLGNEIRFFDGPAEFNGANRDGVSYNRKSLVRDVLSDQDIIEEIIADEIGNIAIKRKNYLLKVLKKMLLHG